MYAYSFRSGSRARPGVALALVAVSLIALFAMIALAVDVGWMVNTKAELQNSADAAALAAAMNLNRLGAVTLNDPDSVYAAAKKWAEMQVAGGKSVKLRDGVVDVVIGQSTQNQSTGVWDFVPSSVGFNSVQVTVRRDSLGPAGPIPTFFGGIIGRTQQDVSATAVAMFVPRDINIVFDISGSMMEDSSLTNTQPRRGNRGNVLPPFTVNNYDVWCALVNESFADRHVQKVAVGDGMIPYKVPDSIGESKWSGKHGHYWGILGGVIPYGEYPGANWTVQDDPGLVFIPPGFFNFRTLTSSQPGGTETEGQYGQTINYGHTWIDPLKPSNQQNTRRAYKMGNLIGNNISSAVNASWPLVMSHLTGKGYSDEEIYILRMPQDPFFDQIAPRNPASDVDGFRNWTEFPSMSDAEFKTQTDAFVGKASGDSTRRNRANTFINNHMDGGEREAQSRWRYRVAAILDFADWQSNLLNPALLDPPAGADAPPAIFTNTFGRDPSGGGTVIRISTPAIWDAMVAAGQFDLFVDPDGSFGSVGTLSVAGGVPDGILRLENGKKFVRGAIRRASPSGPIVPYHFYEKQGWSLENEALGNNRIEYNHSNRDNRSFSELFNRTAPDATVGTPRKLDDHLLPHYTSPADAWRVSSWISYVAWGSYHSASSFWDGNCRFLRYRFGVKTASEPSWRYGAVDGFQHHNTGWGSVSRGGIAEYGRHPRNHYAPIMPMHAARDAVMVFANLLKAQAEGVHETNQDRVGIAVFTTNAQVRNLIVAQTNDYDRLWRLEKLSPSNKNPASGGLTIPISYMQAAHWEGGTNLGGGIRRAWWELSGARDPSSFRSATKKILLVLTDGMTKEKYRRTGSHDSDAKGWTWARPAPTPVGGVEPDYDGPEYGNPGQPWGPHFKAYDQVFFTASQYANDAPLDAPATGFYHDIPDIATREDAYYLIKAFNVSFYVVLFGNDADPYLGNWLAERSGGICIWAKGNNPNEYIDKITDAFKTLAAFRPVQLVK